jgi:class 3 adenylate cyclase
MEISTAIKSHPEIRLRMGIHSGPVNQVVDVNERANVAGAGIDMAQRVMVRSMKKPMAQVTSPML